MLDTGLLASEEQKRELLPDMAALKLIGAWGLTEPSNGSDASALQTTARKVLMPMGSVQHRRSLMLILFKAQAYLLPVRVALRQDASHFSCYIGFMLQ